MSKHTPGPWFVFNGGDIFTGLGAANAEGDHCADNDGWYIADVQSKDLNMDEIRANAHLIAAAPVLLSALQYIEGLAMADDFRDMSTILSMARYAIAKAIGETK